MEGPSQEEHLLINGVVDDDEIKEEKEEEKEEKEEVEDDSGRAAVDDDDVDISRLEPTAKQIADWVSADLWSLYGHIPVQSKCPAKGTEKCWNPSCPRSAVVDSTYKSRKCCGSNL